MTMEIKTAAEMGVLSNRRWMISPPFPRYTIASLRQVGVSSLTPLPPCLCATRHRNTQKAEMAHSFFCRKGEGGKGCGSALTKRAERKNKTSKKGKERKERCKGCGGVGRACVD